MKHNTLIVAGLFLLSTAALALEETSPKRIDEVHQSMQQAVPFAVDQTLQTFTKTVHCTDSLFN